MKIIYDGKALDGDRLILDVPNCGVIRAETSRAKVLYERLLALLNIRAM